MSKPNAIEVDLYSDTVTRPTAEMRRFMCEAEVGDEQKCEDPTVNLLQEMVAELLGKEAAVFLPSGTMCNEIAAARPLPARRRDAGPPHRAPDPLRDAAAPPRWPASTSAPLDGARGQFDAAALEAGIRPRRRHFPRSRLVWVEQTSNLGGGSVWPLADDPGGDRGRAPSTASPPTWTAPG